ncbi:MAG: hypothetical protein NWF07_15450 [Candidatus Bathyarchaeota archaeon]|nr:hypothetical protein [Candidatus Bathyarchaeota archaeon]
MTHSSSDSSRFSVELQKKEYVSELVLSMEPRNTVLITGDLGKIRNITLLEEMVLEFLGTNGRIRLDITIDELLAFLSHLQDDS